MRIAVYSGSFNPLHIGHLAILRLLVERYDGVYLIVSPQNPFKDASGNATAADRLQAAREAVARHPELGGKVRVDDIELGMEPPHYTVRTLCALREREPSNGFTLAIGADNLESMPRWREHEVILREFGVTVFPRKGYHRGRLKARLLREDPSYRIELLQAPLVTISSTEIREALASGQDASRWLM
jgi:nicotinate-nucleotide adenylyltransferase